MLFDLANISYKSQIFYSTSVWNKPNGISMVFMIAIGGGGGGGGGQVHTGGSGGVSYGGSGGGGGAISSLLIPEFSLPDRLYLTIGQGGNGGSSAVTGSAGGSSTIESYFSNANSNATILLNANGGNGGQAGTTGTVGGAGGTATSTTPQHTSGIYNSNAGQQGGSGSNGNGTSLNLGEFPAYPLITGGAGGGGFSSGSAFQGGYINSLLVGVNQAPLIEGGNLSNGGGGSNGVFSLSPFFSLGGSGALSSGLNTIPYNGGSGSIGAGGGGGGSGTTTAGSGGRGGNGIIMIFCW